MGAGLISTTLRSCHQVSDSCADLEQRTGFVVEVEGSKGPRSLKADKEAGGLVQISPVIELA